MTEYNCNKEQHDMCENSSLCHLCDGERLFKKPKWMKIKERQVNNKLNGVKKKKKEGMDFEKKVASAYNKQVTKKNTSARRQPNSGAIWSMPGDIITEEGILMECKERGTKTSSGEKSITIHKEWLEKVSREAAGKYWILPFGFKGSDDIYIAKEYQQELEMIQTIKILKDRVMELEEIIDGGISK